MNRPHVNPNKMELTKVKRRLKMARRGHQLLSDKQSELVRAFIAMSRQNRSLRSEVEEELVTLMRTFVSGRLTMTDAEVQSAVAHHEGDISASTSSLMGVELPVFEAIEATAEPLSDEVADSEVGLSGKVHMTDEMSRAIEGMRALQKKLVALAQVEKSCQLMAVEIEKTRRRVNVLEYVMIPGLDDTVREIRGKLDERERSSRVRLMKVKSMFQDRE